MLSHSGSSAGYDRLAFLCVGFALSAMILYGIASGRLRRYDRRGWERWRTISFFAGATLLVWALLPAALPFPPADFRQHVLQHLLLGMFAPFLLALGAPMTLSFRSFPPAHVRTVATMLRARPLRLLAHPAIVVLSSVGGMVILYFGPLYELAEQHGAVHALVHAHFFVSGYVFAWVMAGADPAPHRPRVPVRLVWIGTAIVGHAVVAQLLYAGQWTDVPVPAAQRRAAAELMYYGGDIAQLLLAFAVVTTWHPSRRGRGAQGSLRSTAGVPRSNAAARVGLRT